MIPNALTNRGPYASFWGHLRSIDHALVRVLDQENPQNLTELDRDRIEELVSFLQDAVAHETPETEMTSQNLFSAKTGKSDYSSAIDLRQRINSVGAFQQWHRASKKGFEAKMQQLIKVAEQYLRSSNGALIRKEAPREEFEIMRSIAQSLLVEAEAALQG